MKAEPHSSDALRIRIPEQMIEAIDKVAATEMRTRSNYIGRAIARALSEDGAPVQAVA